MTLCWSLDKAGPICRSAEDAAVVFNYLHGTDGLDASAVNMPFNYTGKTDWKKLKIAYAKNYFDRDTAAHNKPVLEVFRKLGVNLIPVVFPDSGVYYGSLIRTILSAESAAAFDDLTRSNLDDLLTMQNRGDWPNYFRAARFVPAVEYINANRHRYLLMRNVNRVLQQYDVIIVPTYAGNQLSITNLTGHPALCMPNGFNNLRLPTSITFLGKLYGEANLLAVGKAYQDATGWDEMHPQMFK
jgi:Asp-tRNA(Asn)/Glu-tRNA(Gln) amidotransferase A subunit family amidase